MDKLIHLFNSILPISEYEEMLIRKYLKIETFKKREKYCESGKVCKQLGFVEEGIFKVVRTNSRGDEFIPYFISEGHFAVDLDSFTNRTFSEEYIEALAPCSVVTISRSVFDKFEQEILNFSRIIAHLKEKALVEKNKLKSEMLADDAETRYRKLLKVHPSIIQRVPQNNIAQYLGVTQYTLSRIRGKQ